MSENSWQPMDSAPRDGTPLLLFARSKRATASVVLVGWFGGDDLGWIEGCFTPNNPVGIVPTAWMPLPDPPAQDWVPPGFERPASGETAG